MLTLLLPETLGQPLTSTLEEAEALGREPSKKNSAQGNKDAEGGLEMKQNEAKAWVVYSLKTRETDSRFWKKEWRKREELELGLGAAKNWNSDINLLDC